MDARAQGSKNSVLSHTCVPHIHGEVGQAKKYCCSIGTASWMADSRPLPRTAVYSGSLNCAHHFGRNCGFTLCAQLMRHDCVTQSISSPGRCPPGGAAAAAAGEVGSTGACESGPLSPPGGGGGCGALCSKRPPDAQPARPSTSTAPRRCLKVRSPCCAAVRRQFTAAAGAAQWHAAARGEYACTDLPVRPDHWAARRLFFAACPGGISPPDAGVLSLFIPREIGGGSGASGTPCRAGTDRRTRRIRPGCPA